MNGLRSALWGNSRSRREDSRSGLKPGDGFRPGDNNLAIERGEFFGDRILEEQIKPESSLDHGEGVLKRKSLRFHLGNLIRLKIQGYVLLKLVDRRVLRIRNLPEELEVNIVFSLRRAYGEPAGLHGVMNKIAAVTLSHHPQERFVADIVDGAVDLDKGFIFQKLFRIEIVDLLLGENLYFVQHHLGIQRRLGVIDSRLSGDERSGHAGELSVNPQQNIDGFIRVPVIRFEQLLGSVSERAV